MALSRFCLQVRFYVSAPPAVRPHGESKKGPGPGAKDSRHIFGSQKDLIAHQGPCPPPPHGSPWGPFGAPSVPPISCPHAIWWILEYPKGANPGGPYGAPVLFLFGKGGGGAAQPLERHPSAVGHLCVALKGGHWGKKPWLHRGPFGVLRGPRVLGPRGPGSLGSRGPGCRSPGVP